MFLDSEKFKAVVENTAMFSIDIVLIDGSNCILLGERTTPPAQGYWFVPGGRVYKGEPLSEAFRRICVDELGTPFNYNDATPLGVYDHFYDDSVFGKDVNTHYINLPCLVKDLGNRLNTMPRNQHRKYRWFSMDELETDGAVHKYSRVFIDSLKNHLKIKK